MHHKDNKAAVQVQYSATKTVVFKPLRATFLKPNSNPGGKKVDSISADIKLRYIKFGILWFTNTRLMANQRCVSIVIKSFSYRPTRRITISYFGQIYGCQTPQYLAQLHAIMPT